MGRKAKAQNFQFLLYALPLFNHCGATPAMHLLLQYADAEEGNAERQRELQEGHCTGKEAAERRRRERAARWRGCCPSRYEHRGRSCPPPVGHLHGIFQSRCHGNFPPPSDVAESPLVRNRSESNEKSDAKQPLSSCFRRHSTSTNFLK